MSENCYNILFFNERVGMCKTIFMIHGMWGGPDNWAHYKDFFEKEGYQCIVPTLRYHDIKPSDTPDPRLGQTSLLDYAEDLEKEIRTLDALPIIMGHSMGGLLAQILASRGLAHTVVLLSPGAPAGISSITLSGIRGFLSIQSKWGFWKKPIRQTFKEAAYSILNLLSPEEQKEAYAKFVYESGRAASEIVYWFFDPKHASQVDASKVTCPTLVITGSKDKIIPAFVVRKVAKKYENVSTYKEFENHAHWILAEPDWEDVARYTANWLEKSKS